MYANVFWERKKLLIHCTKIYVTLLFIIIIAYGWTRSPHDSKWWAMEPEPTSSHLGLSWTWTYHDLNSLLFEEHHQLKCESSSFNSKQRWVGSLVLKGDRARKIEPGIKRSVREWVASRGKCASRSEQKAWVVSINGCLALSVVHQGICKLCPQECAFAYICVPEY